MQTEYTVRDVSHMLSLYHMKDIETLRSKYFKLTQSSSLANMSKEGIVRALVRVELGDKAIDAYDVQMSKARDVDLYDEDDRW